MRIAIDASSSKKGHAIRGIGRNTRELIDNINRLLIGNKEGIIVEAVDFSRDSLLKYDILHYTSFNPFKNSIKIIPGKKNIVTIHDLIPLLYPKNYPPGFKGSLNYMMNKILIKKADALITISNTSKKDIVRFLGVDPKKVFVSYLASSNNFRNIKAKKDLLQKVKNKYLLPNKFVLYVGDVNYNKNIPTLIDACKIANYPLVICGKNATDLENSLTNIKNLKGPRDYLRFMLGQQHPEIAHYNLILKLIKDNSVIRTGFVSEDELVAIYNLASLYVQPSYYEGFGLQVLEAMACNTPVIITRTNALVEIASGSALVCDGHSASDMAEKISKVMSDPGLRAELIKKGSKRVKDFSWRKNAFETLSIYKSVAGIDVSR